MRILMINDHLQLSGGGDAVLRLERQAYENAGHEVYSFSHGEEIPKNMSERDTVCLESKERILQKAGKFIGSTYVYRNLKRLLFQIRPHLVRVHLVSKYPAAIYPALEGFRVIQTLHGPNLFCASSWGNLRLDGGECEMGIGYKCWSRGCVSLCAMALYSQLYIRLRPWLKKAVTLYHCPSINILKSAKLLRLGPTMHIPLAIDETFMATDAANHQGTPTILYVGSLIEEKGLLYVPEALSRIKQRIPDVKLIICGRGPLRERLDREIAKRSLQTNVEFKGFVDHSKIVELYRQAMVLICPSIYNEQFGLVGPEALACGVPCVGSNLGGIPEWLHDNEWGYLVEPRDAIALGDRVAELLSNRELRLRFGAQGRIFTKCEYNPAVYSDTWLKIVERYAEEPVIAKRGRQNAA
jgi:glycosyltransferase involved in cell wall biosynthesis